jgi:hypothetical protein
VVSKSNSPADSVVSNTVAKESRDPSPNPVPSGPTSETISMGDSRAWSSDMESSCDYETDDDSKLDSEDLTISIIVSRAKDRIIERVMTEFSEVFNNHQEFQNRAMNIDRGAQKDSRPSSTRTSTEPSKSTTSSGTGSMPTKRNFGDRVSQGSDEQEEDDKGKRIKKNLPSPRHVHSRTKFACPFYKRNPEKHQKWRSCAGPGWDEVRRAKLVGEFLSMCWAFNLVIGITFIDDIPSQSFVLAVAKNSPLMRLWRPIFKRIRGVLVENQSL